MMELYECKKCGKLVLSRQFAMAHWFGKHESINQWGIENFHLTRHFNEFRLVEESSKVEIEV